MLAVGLALRAVLRFYLAPAVSAGETRVPHPEEQIIQQTGCRASEWVFKIGVTW